MDFLDPKKERRTRFTLLLGYCLVALAIGIATLVLLYQSYGYNLDNEGQVTQNGLVFVSSQPNGATIYLNGKRYKNDTNTRVTVPAATYNLTISEAGYRTWQRQIVVNGGDVQHFDYPFLFPSQLKTSTLGVLNTAPPVATQSPDKRWLLLAKTDTSGAFLQYDFKDPKKPVTTTVTLPDGSFTPGSGTDKWDAVEWAADNKHVLLKHTYTLNGAATHEYVLMDRDSPVDSVDLTTALHLEQTQAVSLFNNRASQFYIYDQTTQTLERVNASDGSIVSQLSNILAFKTYGSNYVLYVTDKSPTGKALPKGQVAAVLQAGQKTITLRTLPVSTTTDALQAYPLNLAQYDGKWYVAVASDADSAVYVYRDPQNQSTVSVDDFIAPWRRLPVANPNFLSFSSNTQFLLAENAGQFVVYDFENLEQYRYTASQPIDRPQLHATWMDGDRLAYVSGGKLVVFDYDYKNQQTLQAADAAYSPFFASDFSYLYAIKPASADGKMTLTSTPLTLKK
jgi:hypothetical protein